ncbi:FtsX-like permease family protein [Streptomyces sp. NPDC057257]|uniref:FtsX-like permease family protein n=1 Tax=Streptomyces sp. NPDC057257 TaxID=3346071 RepID=UPI00363E4417
MNRIPAPWIRTRLRTAPAAAAALALLVALTACLAGAFPRAVDRYEDAGLRHAVERARPLNTSMTVYAQQPDPLLSQQQREDALRPAALDVRYDKVLAALRRPFVADRAQSTYGVRTANPQKAPDPFLPQPYGLPAQIELTAQEGLAAHATVKAGRLPRADGRVTATTPEVEAAVSAETAKSLHIKVGSVIHVPGSGRAPLAVRVTGIITPRDPGGAYWATHELLHTPNLIPVPNTDFFYWLGALLLPPDAAPALLGTAGDAQRYWQLAPDVPALRSHELDDLKSAVASMETGPDTRRLRAATDPSTNVTTYLDDVLDSYGALRGRVRPLVAVAAFGTGTVAAVVLLMAAGLAADRRAAELTLLRARGASLRGLATRLFAETAVVAVPAWAVGLALALLAVPTDRAAYAVAAATAVALVACAALPVRAMAVHRRVRVHAARADVSTVRPSRRRTVAELTLVVVALGAVESLRRTGTSGGQLSSLAPVLIATAAALLLIRLYPLPLRALARPAARLRGTVTHLSLARAGRTSASAVLPLLALLTALTTAAFGGSVLAGVHAARDHAAYLAVGADARVETPTPLPADLPERVRRVPGVRALSAVSLSYESKPGDGEQTVPVAGVNPQDYAELAARTGLGPFGAGELAKRPATEPQPALASPAVAARYGTRSFPVRLEDGSTITVRVAAVVDRTPAVIGADFLVVNRAVLDTRAARPSALLLTGSGIQASTLRKAAGSSAQIQLRSEERAEYGDSPLQSGAERVYGAAVAAGAGYAVLALLLSLLRAAPERRALLARLRTMGLTRAQGRRLLILESLPQAALAAAGGALTGWATIRLLSPGVDLTTIALATHETAGGQAVLRTDALSLVLPAAAILLVTVGVAGAQAWWTGRQGAVAELRAGDAR